MSDNIPFEIQSEIIKHLPVKSLIQFRSVSKPWKSLIDSSDFITHYQSPKQHLLVSYHDHNSVQKYVSIVDDDTFPQHKVNATIPPLPKSLKHYHIVGCSHGLFCLYGVRRKRCVGPVFGSAMAVLWNLSIRKAVAVVVPNVAYGIYHSVLGFGVCPVTNDPKILKITQINRALSDLECITNIPWKVEVFTLSTGAWRSPYSSNLPRTSIEFEWDPIPIDGILYWFAIDRITVDGEFRSFCNMIVSFDLTTEEFREVNLPGSLVHTYHVLYPSKLRNSLVVLEDCLDVNGQVIVVWMMEGGVTKSFTKLFTVDIYKPHVLLRGFRESGAPIIEITEDDRGLLVVYEPYSKHIDKFWVHGMKCSFIVYPYEKTLFLLDQKDRMGCKNKNGRLLKHTSKV